MEAPRKKPARSRVSYLPHHVVMEILCRLPIKTLISCKCLCKSWFNLISADSDFAKLHLQRSPSELLFLSSDDSFTSTRFYMGNIQVHNNSAPNLKLSPLFDFPMFKLTHYNCMDYSETHNSNFQFVNICNGLVCFRSGLTYDFAVICNPITGEFIAVPPPKKWNDKSKVVAYGLGFSGKANRYKLLCLMKPTKSAKLYAEICTFEEKSHWRNVGGFPYSSPKVSSSNPVFLEGKLHIHCLRSRPPCTTISCFDFDNELFEEVPLPPYRIDDSAVNIGILGGCLFLSHFRPGSNNCVHVWVMKEYGVKDSWTKAFSIAKYPPSLSFIETYIPIQHLDIGEILMLHHNVDLILHNPVRNSIRTIGRIDYRLKVNAYSPTLLRLKDALMGYDAHVYDVNFRDAYLEGKKLAKIRWWKNVEKNYVQKSPQQQGSKAPLTNDAAVAGEERNGHVSPTSEFSVPESSKTQLACEQGTDVLTSDEIHVPITGEERHGSVSGTGQAQTPASSSATHVTAAVLWGKMKALAHNLGEELRKERQLRQELEQRLQNEVAKVEPLKEQTEDFKQQNQLLEQRLQNEVAKVEPLKEQTEHLKQQNQLLEQRLQNEVAKFEPLKEQTDHLKQQNQQLEQSLRNEQTKVKQLKEQIQQSEQFKQVNQQMMLEMMDEMRAQLGGSQ